MNIVLFGFFDQCFIVPNEFLPTAPKPTPRQRRRDSLTSEDAKGSPN